MNAQAHYDQHLGNFYSWMVGDFAEKQVAHEQFFREIDLLPGSNGLAIDLGAGHGLQAVSLAKLGFSVKAIDFNRQLLDELRTYQADYAIETIKDDILNVSRYADPAPELIVCWGDTLTHLGSEAEVQRLIREGTAGLAPGGKFAVSFRDYTNELTDTDRFIPVKSDERRILTCVLEYLPDKVRATDLLHERTDNGWEQKVSSYEKLRLAKEDVINIMQDIGLRIEQDTNFMRQVVLVGVHNTS